MKYTEAIAEIKKLLKTGEPEQALNLALGLRQIAPQDPVVHQLIKRCTIAIHREEENKQSNFVKNGLTVIKRLLKEGHIEEAVQASRELLNLEPGNPQVQKIHQKTSIAFIELKLHDPLKKQLEAKGDYEKLYHFYLKIRHIFPEYTKLKKLITQTERKLIEIDRTHKKEFADASLIKLRELFNEGKYEAVINGAEELQAVTHQGSREAAILLKKATYANKQEIEQQTLKIMIDKQPLLQAAYESGRESMLKI